MRTNTIITGLVAFASGFVTGLLLSPKNGKENRKWISNHTRDTKNWIEDHGHKLFEESEKRIDRLSKGLKNTVKENVPDLYRATESLHFSDTESHDS
ncbi:MAG: YtxH domain-containing protein [Balneolaceae bacterium]|nr:YtxH domain-containing protein [Balneolaceae bacterium]